MATPESKPEQIGEFLVKIGAMQPWQVDDVLLAQRSGDKRLFGELAIALGYIDDKALLRYVESQGPKKQNVGA